MKVKIGVIDCTPTWLEILPAILVLLENGTPAGIKQAKKELKNMARAADAYNALLKEQEAEQKMKSKDGYLNPLFAKAIAECFNSKETELKYLLEEGQDWESHFWELTIYEEEGSDYIARFEYAVKEDAHKDIYTAQEKTHFEFDMI